MPSQVRPPSPAALEEAYRTLARAAGSLTDGQRWANLLDVAARHPGRSVTEILAIAHHRPHATQLATYDGWKQLQRQVKRGERGFAILVPDPEAPDGLRYEKVFDLAQTEGRRLVAARPVTADRAAYLLPVFALADGTGFQAAPGLVARMHVGDGVARWAPDAHPHEVGLGAADLLARRVLASPAALADLEAASTVHVVAARFGLSQPQVTYPAPPRWASAQNAAEPHVALTAALGRVLHAADQITDRIVASQQRSQPTPDARPQQATEAPTPTAAVHVTEPAADLDALRAVHDQSAAFFAAQLPGQAAAAGYLRSRGIDSEAADPRWRIGYAPATGHALLDHLRGLGFADQLLLDAGVAVPRTTTGELRDRWINRLMFPVSDHTDQVIAFIGRDLSPGHSDRIPKWLNSGTTPLFTKSNVLFGLGQQLPGLHLPAGANLQVAVVEGPADVLAVRHAYAGLQPQTFTIAVAPCGTAFTQAQFDLLTAQVQPWRPQLLLGFDSDSAGTRAFGKVYDMARGWPHGPVAGLAALAQAKDPAELLALQGADEALLTLLAAERPLPLLAIEHALDRLEEPGFDPDSPEQAAAAFHAVSEYVFHAADVGAHALALEEVASRLGLSLGRVVQGVTTAFEQQHGLFDVDEPGPGPPRTATPVHLAAASFESAASPSVPPALTQQSAVPSQAAAAARR